MLEMEMGTLRPAARARLDSLHARTSTTTTLPKGLPLRTRHTETVADSAGQQRAIVTTMEYTELTHGPVDRSLFAVPDGYRIMDMRNMPGFDESLRRGAARVTMPNLLCPPSR